MKVCRPYHMKLGVMKSHWFQADDEILVQGKERYSELS